MDLQLPTVREKLFTDGSGFPKDPPVGCLSKMGGAESCQRNRSANEASEGGGLLNWDTHSTRVKVNGVRLL
ncbi:Hypothetical protein SMAX5B_018309 [Scophthalmus maximus]|uniref:Uncharacterized protein n=1 Tax=Scophthalmus maximus TaxID=52904 RepID=A0A2U9CCQ4_SCOMX|nr:Hypothetical protein SMAX5B_018309 [Scophthalmus maximus]